MANPNLDFLSLAEGCIYNLTVVNNSDPDGDNGLPVINKTLTIKGNGATIMRQSTPAVPKFRIFLVASAGDLTLDELTVDNGDTSGVDAKAGRGGGISNHGTLKVINSTLSHNHGAFGGGGIGNGDPQEVPPPRTPGKLTLIDSVLFDNSGGIGGAIANGLNSVINLTGSAISDNTSVSEGGGVASQGTATLDKCTISRNTTAGNGGGIVNGGQLFLTNSPITGNSATGPVSSQLGFGGGILNSNGTVTLTHSDVTGNSANNDGGGIGNGPGTIATLTNSEVTGNSTTSDGGGIANAGHMTLARSNVTRNTGHDGGGISNKLGAASLTLAHSDVIDNTALHEAGGIFNQAGNKVTLNQSTVTGNTPDDF